MAKGILTIKCQRYEIENHGVIYPYFLGAYDPKELRKVSDAPSFQPDTPNQQIATEVLNPPTKHWQRPLDEDKVLEISRQFDLARELMPNPILLAVRPEADVQVLRETNANGSETGLWLVKLPIPQEKGLKPLWIIDGQHRLAGLSQTTISKTPIPFVLLQSDGDVYIPAVLARIFAQVTTQAKPLNPIHQAWMMFVFNLGVYSDQQADWRAMKTTALLCHTQAFDGTPNVFYNKILFNPELPLTSVNPGGFAFSAPELQELLKSKYFSHQGGKHASLSEIEVAEQIALAMDALKRIVTGDKSESAFFGEASHEQKYFRDGFLAGVCAQLWANGKPRDWTKLLKALNFGETDWDVTSWVTRTGGRAGTVSKGIAFASFMRVFKDGKLPDGVPTMCDYLQGQASFLEVEYQEVTDQEKLVKGAKTIQRIELVGGVDRPQIRIPADCRSIKISSNCPNVGTVTIFRKDSPFDDEYSFSKFKRGRIFSQKELAKLKNKVVLDVKVELYGDNTRSRIVTLNFNA